MQVVIRVRFRLAIRRDPVPRRFRVFARGRTISMQTEREREKGRKRGKKKKEEEIDCRCTYMESVIRPALCDSRGAFHRC